MTVFQFMQSAVLAATLSVFGMQTTWAQEPVTIAAFGDSLSAGYQLEAHEAFPVQLEKALQNKGYNAKVINAAVSGDTTSGGRSRLDWSIGEEVDMVILELGANDALRGVDPAATRENLSAMIARLQERGIAVVLAGMMAPRNWGDEYAQAFDAIYPELAQEYNVPLYPFFLEGVATDPKLNLADGMHPTGEGIGVIVNNILPTVEKTMQTVISQR